jgi:TP901-1 family phage major tail protein
MAMNGTELLILVNIGTPGVPALMAIGSQRDATIEEATGTIDISSKDSRAQRVLPGRYSAKISMDALYVPNDATYQALRNANRNGNLILVAWEEAGVVLGTANAKIDSMSQSFPDQGEAKCSLSLTVDGFFEEVGS